MSEHWKSHKPYWVIDMNTDAGHGLIGRWWFEDGRRIPEPPLAALRTATFHTRREAREYLKLARKSLPNARLVRALVKFEACAPAGPEGGKHD